MKINIVHVDTCLTAYWGGHHLPFVQVPVYRGVTMQELRASIRGEINEGAIGGSTDDARLLADAVNGPEEQRRADRLHRAALAGVKRLRPAKPKRRKLFLDLDESPDDDCADTVYAFFILEVVE